MCRLHVLLPLISFSLLLHADTRLIDESSSKPCPQLEYTSYPLDSVTAEERYQVFRELLDFQSHSPEILASPKVADMARRDLRVIHGSLGKWHNQGRAQTYRRRIAAYVASHPIPDSMSFKEHGYLFFCLSALMSGIEEKDLNATIQKQIHTMVAITVHPHGPWSVKTELENQNYAKYIFHVSPDGLADVRTLNAMTSVRVKNAQHDFIPVRLIGVACDEIVGFDGVEDTGSLGVVIHDFIHAGFLKRAFMDNESNYWMYVEKVGSMWEQIAMDESLKKDSQLEMKVQGAWFMWSHELTTSPFVDGWPRTLPKSKWYLGGIYASRPQILLRLGAKIGHIPTLFKNEIKTEQGLLRHLGLTVFGIEYCKMSEHEKIKEIMELLSPGYEFLSKCFGEQYGQRSRWTVIKNRLTDMIRLLEKN